jgi:hypothetical protein
MIEAGFIKQPLEVLAALVIEAPQTSTSLFARAKKMLGGDAGIRNNGALIYYSLWRCSISSGIALKRAWWGERKTAILSG